MATQREINLRKAVFAYIRQHSTNIKFINNMTIPQPIINMIFEYYFIKEDRFSGYDPMYFDVTDDGKVANLLKGLEWRTVYGTEWIKSTNEMVVIWTIKLIKLPIQNINLGVTTTTNKDYGGTDEIGNFCRNKNSPCYALWGCSCGTMSNNVYDGSYSRENSSGWWGVREGNLIKIVLDLKKREISFWVNNENLGVAFKDITVNKDTNYILAVSMLNKGVIALQNFEIE